MAKEMVFKAILFLAFIGMLVIRIYYQLKIVRDKRKVEIKEGSISLIAGSIAAFTSIVFGAEYIFFQGVFSFAYGLRYPDWVRWSGGIMLAGG
jgi:hypothetical protein